MELREIPVVYCDENAVWGLFSSNVLKRLPLKDVHYHDLNRTQQVIPELPVRFAEQQGRGGMDGDEGLHEKPYLAVFILHCTELEVYRTISRSRLKSWIESQDANKQEWMILYVPALTMLTDSQNKTYIKIYDKLQSDIGAMTGIRKDRCTRFFSVTKRKYVSIDQLSANSDEFWKDAIRFIADFIGQSIESRMATLTERILLYDEMLRKGENSFFPYCVVNEGLAFLYLVVNQPSLAFKNYEEMLRNMEGCSDCFTDEGERNDFELTMEKGLERYRDKMVSGEMSDLEFLEYVMTREKRLLTLMDMPLYLSQKFLQFLFAGIKLLKSHKVSEGQKAAWTHVMAAYSIESIKQEEYSKDYVELKIPYEIGQLHYVMGLLYTLVQCQLIRNGDIVSWEEMTVNPTQPSSKFLPSLDGISVKQFASGREKVSIDPVVFNSGDTTPSQALLDETVANIQDIARKEENLQEVTKSVVHAFQQCNYGRRALFYQAQLACLWKKCNQLEEAANLLKFIIPSVDDWKEMQLALELQLLDCLLKQKKPRDAFEVAVNICSKGAEVVRPETASRLCAWIFDLIHNPFLREELVLPASKMLDVSVSFLSPRYTVGEKASISVKVSCKLPTDHLHVDRFQVSLLGTDSHGLISDKVMIFAVNDIYVSPNVSTIVLESKAEAAGVFKFRRAVFHVGRLKLMSDLEDKSKVVFEADHLDVVLQAKIPSLLVFGHLQTFMVEVQNKSRVINDARLSWLPMRVTGNVGAQDRTDRAMHPFEGGKDGVFTAGQRAERPGSPSPGAWKHLHDPVRYQAGRRRLRLRRGRLRPDRPLT